MKLNISKKVVSIASAIVLLAGLVSVCFGVNSYFAKSAELELVGMRLDQKILMDRFRNVQQRIWDLEDRCHRVACSPEEKSEIQHLKLELEEIKMELERLKTKGG